MNRKCIMCGSKMNLKKFDHKTKWGSKSTTVEAEGHVCENIVCKHKSFDFHEAKRLQDIASNL